MTRPSSPAEKLLLESRAIVLNSDQREIVLAELEGLRARVKWAADIEVARVREYEAHALTKSALDDANKEIARLREGMTKAIDLADEGWSYASNYFRQKYGSEPRIFELRDHFQSPAPKEAQGSPHPPLSSASEEVPTKEKEC